MVAVVLGVAVRVRPGSLASKDNPGVLARGAVELVYLCGGQGVSAAGRYYPLGGWSAQQSEGGGGGGGSRGTTYRKIMKIIVGMNCLNVAFATAELQFWRAHRKGRSVV